MIAKALLFLAEHADLIELLAEAIDGGLSKDIIKEAIKKAMVAASDAAVKEEIEAGAK